MRIGIDVRKIGDSGIGRYIENLVTQLVTIDEQNDYVLFFATGEDNQYDFPSDRVTKVIEPSGKYSVREHFSLAQNAARHGVDLFHAPHYTVPLMLKSPSVVTIHDIIHLQDRSVGLAARTYARFMIGAAIRKAERIITVSSTTRDSLIQQLNVAPDKVAIIHNGGGDFGALHEQELSTALSKLNMTPGYILFVGSDRPHKNINAAAEVMSRMRPDSRMVVVGRVANRTAFDILGDRVIFLEHLQKPDMEAVYCGAAALLFPSYLEGFGLPPLEAMACRTPVVASNRSAIPEITGDAAMLCDPDDITGMVNALTRIIDDENFRTDLVERGARRIKEFSWHQCAEQTLAVYNEAGTT